MTARRLIILFASIVVAVMLQTTALSRPIVSGARPDLVLLIVVTYSVVQGVSEGMMAGVVGGLAVDLCSGVPFGSATLGMWLVGLLTGLGDSNVYRANLLIPIIAVFLATVIYHSFLMLSLQANGWTVEWISTLALQTVPSAFMNAILTPVGLYLARHFAFPTEHEEKFEW